MRYLLGLQNSLRICIILRKEKILFFYGTAAFMSLLRCIPLYLAWGASDVKFSLIHPFFPLISLCFTKFIFFSRFWEPIVQSYLHQVFSIHRFKPNSNHKYYFTVSFCTFCRFYLSKWSVHFLNSCYYRQSFSYLQQHTDEANGSIRW